MPFPIVLDIYSLTIADQKHQRKLEGKKFD